jgi:adenosylhomocysteine nucleosidase
VAGVAIVAALPREIAGLVRGIKPEAAWLKRNIHLSYVNSPDAVVVAAGMGAERVTFAVQAALEDYAALWAIPVDMLISVGLAGSCVAEVKPGEVVVAKQVVDALTGERYATEDSNAKHILVSSDTIASVAEKQRVAQSYGATMVDMEAATVARLARARGLRFRAIKAISDAHDFEIESLGKFADANGQFRTAAFALHTALRPSQWPLAMELGRNSRVALEALTQTLRTVIEQGS